METFRELLVLLLPPSFDRELLPSFPSLSFSRVVAPEGDLGRLDIELELVEADVEPLGNETGSIVGVASPGPFSPFVAPPFEVAVTETTIDVLLGTRLG